MSRNDAGLVTAWCLNGGTGAWAAAVGAKVQPTGRMTAGCACWQTPSRMVLFWYFVLVLCPALAVHLFLSICITSPSSLISIFLTTTPFIQSTLKSNHRCRSSQLNSALQWQRQPRAKLALGATQCFYMISSCAFTQRGQKPES